MDAQPKIWLRSIAHHTYWNILREPDTFYCVDTAQDADTIVALKFGVREDPPAKAVRTPQPEPAPAVVMPTRRRSRPAVE